VVYAFPVLGDPTMPSLTQYSSCSRDCRVKSNHQGPWQRSPPHPAKPSCLDSWSTLISSCLALNRGFWEKPGRCFCGGCSHFSWELCLSQESHPSSPPVPGCSCIQLCLCLAAGKWCGVVATHVVMVQLLSGIAGIKEP